MQKQIELTDKTVLVVGLPSDVYDVRFKTMPDESREFCGSIKDNLGNLGTCYINEIPKGFELVGIHPELTEEECKMIVERLFFAEAKPHPYYVNYTDETYYCDTAKEAFDTLMQKLECYTVNPYGDYFADLAYGGDTHLPTFEQWQEAEQSTFPKWAVLIRKNV